jgi:conjugative transfer signal peptidase TraF
MKRRPRLSWPVVVGLAALVLVNVALLGAYALGLRINTTASMPQGVYRLRPLASGPVALGTVVAICPSAKVLAVAAPRHYFEPGPCPGNVEPLLKHVAAVGGDRVDVSDRAIIVNGRPLPNSGRLARDCAGRSLPHAADGRYRIASDDVWLYAPVARSWDSRYFGPQPAADIVGTATPLLIVGTGKACAQ